MAQNNLIDDIKKQKKEDDKMTKDIKKGQLKQHDNEIKKLRAHIKKHKLMKRQVRLTYRISTGKRWF